MEVESVKRSYADSISQDRALQGQSTTPKGRVIDLLDDVERHVDILRRDLLLLEEKKDELLTTLDTIRNSDLVAQLSCEDSTEVGLYADRLAKTCSSIEIKVTTLRDQRQEDALYQVNRLIDSLVLVLRSDPQSAHNRCLSYVSACNGSTALCRAVEVGEEEEDDEASLSPQQQFIPDAVFEEVMFLCTPDDRKRVQRRLHGLLSYIEREMVQLLPPTL